jgi:peptide/nickel transport system substrate-binding protein
MDEPHEDDPRPPPPSKGVSRRVVLSGLGALGAFGTVSALLAACASDSTTTTPTTGSASNGTTATAAPGTQAATTVAAAPTKGGDLIIDVQTEGQGFNPLQYPNAAYAWLTRQVVDSLYWYDDDSKLVPVLADGDPVTTDGTTWTVKLKDGVKFHNGDPFTAEHVVATLKQALIAPTNVWAARLGGFTNVEALDDKTVKLTYPAPNYYIPEVLGMVPMLHKDHLTEQITVMGTGAFVWKELVPGSHVLMEANPDYHMGPPLVDSVTFQFVPDASTRVVNVLQGNSHICMLPSFDTLAKLDADKNVDVVKVSAAVMMPVHVNTKSAVFKDLKVRQALGYATDRTRLRDVVFKGEADIFLGGVVPPTLSGFDPALTVFPPTADVAKAKALLAEAGHTDPVAFTIDVYNVQNAVAAIQVMQQDWTAAGFAPTIQTHDLASFAKILLSKTFDVCLSYEFNGTNWSKSGREPLGVYVTDNFVNFTNYTDPAFDELLASSLAEEDPVKQAAIWAEANKMVGEAAVNLIPVVPRLTLAKRSNVSGLPLKPLELSFLRLHGVSIAS